MFDQCTSSDKPDILYSEQQFLMTGVLLATLFRKNSDCSLCDEMLEIDPYNCGLGKVTNSKNKNGWNPYFHINIFTYYF
jgi:hypothetical protein